jgi:hypothetical protein
MMFSVANFLKLVSFHHVMFDNRGLMRRLKESKQKTQADANFFNIN